MDVGLLWFDNDAHRGLEEKIGDAARRYQAKFGRLPNLCYVNPQAVAGSAGPEAGVTCRVESLHTTIRVQARANILVHHLWLGETIRDADLARPLEEVVPGAPRARKAPLNRGSGPAAADPAPGRRPPARS